MAGPTIARAEVTVDLDGKKFLVEARIMAAEGAKIMDKELNKGAEKSGDKSGKTYTRGFLGRLKGSRNDFLNVIGGATSGLTNLVIDSVRGIGKAWDVFAGGFSSGNTGGFGGFFKGLQGGFDEILPYIKDFGKAFKGNVWAVLAEAVVVVVAFGAAVSVASSLLMGLLGIATALASSLAYAVGGAILALGPMLAAAAAGVAVLVLAIQGMSDKTKAALKPLTKYFDDLGKQVSGELFGNLKQQIKDLLPLLNEFLSPLLMDSAKALRGVIDELVGALNRPEIKDSLATLTESLPKILGSLGSALVSVFTGVLGVIAAISPLVEPIAAKIADVAQTFSNWANSAEGKNKIADFFEKAWDSATKVWDILKELGAVIGTVFSSGKDTGDDFLTSIADGLKTFNDQLNSPEGQEKLKDFFQQAKDLASGLMDVLGKVASGIENLNTPEAEQALNNLINIVNGVTNALVWMGEVFSSVMNFLATKGGGLSDFGDGVRKTWNTAYDAVAHFFEAIGTWFGNAWQSAVDWVTNTATTISTFFTELPGKIGAWLGDLGGTLLTWFTNGWNAAVTFWTDTVPTFIAGIPNMILEALGAGVGFLLVFFYNSWTEGIKFWTETLPQFIAGIPDKLTAILTAGTNALSTWFTTMWTGVTSWWTGTAWPWLSSLPGKLWDVLKASPGVLGNWFGLMWGNVTSWWTNTAWPWISGLPGKVWDAVKNNTSILADWFKGMWTGVTSWWDGTAWPWISGLPGKLKGVFSNLWTNVATEVGNAIKGAINSFIRGFNANNGPLPDLPLFARGGIVDSPTLGILGEAGREAVVPLTRPLSQVDPEVRALAAFARGQDPSKYGGGANANGGGKVVNIHPGAVQLTMPTQDPEQAANAVLDRLVARWK
ncbi:MAG: hypothetical protein ABWZ30_05515 [Jiangellaceae bacterium]